MVMRRLYRRLDGKEQELGFGTRDTLGTGHAICLLGWESRVQHGLIAKLRIEYKSSNEAL
jgi:hypothetical protein